MRQQYSSAYKARVVQELLREEKTIAQIAAESGVHPNQLGRWKATAIQGLPSLFDRRDAAEGLTDKHAQETTALYAEIGKLTTQVAWLTKKSSLDPAERGAGSPGRAGPPGRAAGSPGRPARGVDSAT